MNKSIPFLDYLIEPFFDGKPELQERVKQHRQYALTTAKLIQTGKPILEQKVQLQTESGL